MTTGNKTRILIRDFVTQARIGIYPREHEAPQAIRVSVDITLKSYEILRDRIEDTLSYEGMVAAIRDLPNQHFELVEGRKTLARTSDTPGRTQQLNFFDLGGHLFLIDMPGYGDAKVSKARKKEWIS